MVYGRFNCYQLAIQYWIAYSDSHQSRNTKKEATEMNTTEIKARAFQAAVDLATICKPCTYDNVLELTAYSLGIEMDGNDEFPVELYRKFDRVWAELNY